MKKNHVDIKEVGQRLDGQTLPETLEADVNFTSAEDRLLHWIFKDFIESNPTKKGA